MDKKLHYSSELEGSNLLRLINSGDMSHEEKQYWLDIIPYMNDNMKNKFESILQDEEDKLNSIQNKFEEWIKTFQQNNPSIPTRDAVLYILNN